MSYRPVQARLRLLEQCNRQYPCNHCTRRRRPEECVYHMSQSIQEPSPTSPVDGAVNGDGGKVWHQREQSTSHESLMSLPNIDAKGTSIPQRQISLAASFGYFEDSESKTMALVRKVSVHAQATSSYRTSFSSASSMLLQRAALLITCFGLHCMLWALMTVSS